MDVPIDFEKYLANPESDDAKSECLRAAQLLHEYGALAVKDPRVSQLDNNNFLDILESYFNRPYDQILKDARPDIHYQLGVTPEGVELPRCTTDPKCKEIIDKIEPEHRPLFPQGPDAKWRFFHRIGGRPTDTKFPDLNCPPVEPEGFDSWVDTLDTWGNKLIQAVFVLAEMVAVGLNLPKNIFTNLLTNGPHLLAPTGSDLNKNGLGTILAGFHQDLNFLTFHGKSRYAGLFIWLRNGTKQPVSIPDGCLLVQAGMEIEHLTGGYIQAGYHEVVVTEKTVQQVEQAKLAGKPLWRISSTLFSHVASDNILSVVYGTEEEKREKKERYPDISAGDFVRKELEYIQLKKERSN
jgi:isopenicillin N synthase-like dioxygenase